MSSRGYHIDTSAVLIVLQVIAKSYNRECDLWSVGVILFTLMCGYPPFWGDTEREIYGRVKRGYYAFEGPEWQSRSTAVKDLVNMLLVMQPSSRCVCVCGVH